MPNNTQTSLAKWYSQPHWKACGECPHCIRVPSRWNWRDWLDDWVCLMIGFQRAAHIWKDHKCPRAPMEEYKEAGNDTTHHDQ